MNDPNSPIIQKFELDLKRKILEQDWEAVVKIPFIDQARLILDFPYVFPIVS